MSNYSDDDDLIKIRTNILSLGVTDWEDKHIESKEIIDRAIASKWYRTVASDNNIEYLTVPFDSDFLLNDGEQLKRLSCYKTLQLIYLDLTKETPEEDGLERQSNNFAKLYASELKEVLSAGLDYDWDRSGAISFDEKEQTKKRRLRRS